MNRDRDAARRRMGEPPPPDPAPDDEQAENVVWLVVFAVVYALGVWVTDGVRWVARQVVRWR